jgi:glycosyltransferase involved in cell wall biosynthesis
MNRPFVSVICPTYNRTRFLPYLCHMFNIQTYPANRRELIILDDSPQSNEAIINKENKDKNIRYIYHPEKLKLGEKRNMLNNLAKEKGEYIVCMDDDDYYPPEKIQKAVDLLISRKGKEKITGSSEMYIYFTALDQMYVFKKLGPNHATNGTFVYHRSLLKDHGYEDNAKMAEEKYFLKEYTTPMVQSNALSSIICIAHHSNTFDKMKILGQLQLANKKFKHVVKDKRLLEFYKELKEESKREIEIRKKKEAEEDEMYDALVNLNQVPFIVSEDKKIPIRKREDGSLYVKLPNGMEGDVTRDEQGLVITMPNKEQIRLSQNNP